MYEYLEVTNKDIMEGKVSLKLLYEQGWELIKIINDVLYLRRKK